MDAKFSFENIGTMFYAAQGTGWVGAVGAVGSIVEAGLTAPLYAAEAAVVVAAEAAKAPFELLGWVLDRFE